MSCPLCGQRHDTTTCPTYLPVGSAAVDHEQAALERIEHSLAWLTEQVRQVSVRLDEIEHRLRSGAADEEER